MDLEPSLTYTRNLNHSYNVLRPKQLIARHGVTRNSRRPTGAPEFLASAYATGGPASCYTMDD